MRVLILEDDSERLDWFRFVLKNAEVLDIAVEPEMAKKLLEEREYDYIFLDHDLLPNHYDEDTICDKTTGLCVGKFLGENPELSPDAEIIIHSMNPAGSKRIQNALEDGKRTPKWVPYDSLKLRMRVNF